MTIEFSLRRRASLSRRLALAYLVAAIVVLVGSYVSFPSIAGKTLESVNQIEILMEALVEPDNGVTPISHKTSFVYLHIFALIILVLCLSVVSFASYLLGRTAFIELELAARFIGLADALCIAGADFSQLERATALLVPRAKYFPEVSEKNFKTFLEIVKSTRS